MRALVLAAGFGTRLGNMTANTPKALLDVGGSPLISHIVANLARQGICEIAINTHFEATQVEDFLGSLRLPGVTIKTVYEAELLGTLGTAKSLESLLTADGPFLVHYGDILTDADFGELASLHVQRGALATIAVHERHDSNSVAVLDDQGMVSEFRERPTDLERVDLTSPWAFSGIALVDPRALDRVPPGHSDLPADLLPLLATDGRLAAAPLKGYRCAIDSPDRLEEARAALSSGQCTSYLVTS